jgi:hypothetical protein
VGREARIKRARRTARHLLEPQERGLNDRCPNKDAPLIQHMVDRDLRRAQRWLEAQKAKEAAK